MLDRKSVNDIENIEVRKEVLKLLNIFEEGFLNGQLELVICHPINPIDICDWNYATTHPGTGKNVYCNYYFGVKNCQNKNEIKRKVIEWWARAACKTTPAGPKISEQIQNYVRNGINEYLGTSFDRKEWELIYCKLGNGINSNLCGAFILSNYDISLLKGGE